MAIGHTDKRGWMSADDASSRRKQVISANTASRLSAYIWKLSSDAKIPEGDYLIGVSTANLPLRYLGGSAECISSMKNLSTLFALLILALNSTSFAQDKGKSLAISPALHPGTEKRHESFNEISKLGEAPLVFLGDSITQGWNGKGKAAWEKYWVPLGAANFGIGGDRTEHVLWRLQNGNYDGLSPKLTVLMIGTNNTGHQGRAMKEHAGAIYNSTPQETAEGVTEIVKLLQKKQPQMKVLILAIFPRGANNEDPKRKQNETANQLISKLADEKTVYFMDINQAFLEEDGTLSKKIMPDLLHPNAGGYEIWSKEIMAKVKSLIAD